jgi:hypothetical protein
LSENSVGRLSIAAALKAGMDVDTRRVIPLFAH